MNTVIGWTSWARPEVLERSDMGTCDRTAREPYEVDPLDFTPREDCECMTRPTPAEQWDLERELDSERVSAGKEA